MDQLEEQVKDVTTHNKTLHKRVKELERENASLATQLKTLQTVLGRATRNTKATGTCLMVYFHYLFSSCDIMTEGGRLISLD